MFARLFCLVSGHMWGFVESRPHPNVEDAEIVTDKCQVCGKERDVLAYDGFGERYKL